MKTLYLILSLLVFSFQTNAQNQSWKLVKESKDIKVYYRTMPGSEIKEVKIITTFEASLSTIVSVLTNVNDYPKWVYGAMESNVINRISANEMYYYNKLDFPWPLSDRDIVIHTHIKQDPKSKTVISISEANPTLLSTKKDLIRMKEFNSQWTFTLIGNKVLGEYKFKSNPGGNIPPWMINLALDEGPVRTIENFKKVILETKSNSKNDLAILN